MALTETQIADALVLLGLPVRIDVAAGYSGGDGLAFRHSAVARKLLEQVNATQEATVIAILAQYTPIRYDADTIKAEGLDSSPARTRGLLRRQLTQIIGYTYGGGGGIAIARG